MQHYNAIAFQKRIRLIQYLLPIYGSKYWITHSIGTWEVIRYGKVVDMMKYIFSLDTQFSEHHSGTPIFPQYNGDNVKPQFGGLYSLHLLRISVKRVSPNLTSVLCLLLPTFSPKIPPPPLFRRSKYNVLLSSSLLMFGTGRKEMSFFKCEIW